MRWSVVGAAVAVFVLCACGGGSDSGGGGGGGLGTCDPSNQKTMTLSASGVTPKAQCVLPGGTVVFVNNDTAAHEIVGEGACAAVTTGSIGPATSKSATFGATLQTCAFHDAANPNNAAFQGSVTVADAPATGPGY